MATPDNRIARNVFNEPLVPCSFSPVTGFFRDGSCKTAEEDSGNHVICAVMSEEFLAFSRSCGNDLSTPVPEWGFPGLKAGDQWCLCALRWLEAPAGLGWRLRGYVGSVAFANGGSLVVATSPRGGRAVVWSSDDGELLAEVALADVCGIAALEREVLLSSGAGDLLALVEPKGKPASLDGPALRWDNHMLVLPS